MSAGAQNTDPELKKGHSTETNPGQDTGREDIDSAVRDRGLVDTAHAPGAQRPQGPDQPEGQPISAEEGDEVLGTYERTWEVAWRSNRNRGGLLDIMLDRLVRSGSVRMHLTKTLDPSHANTAP